jgi:very-short-patch-repair endonuclease/predicted transcriptional regulator of viral defense system
VGESNEMPADRPETRALALAACQHVVLNAAQLAECGLSQHAIAHRVRVGWLRRMHRGVYLVGPLPAPHSAAMAATLAVGRDALLSHHAAGVLWEVRSAAEGPLDVTVPGRETRHRKGIRTHSARGFHPADARRHHGIPVTSPARTLLDLATELSPRELDRAVNEARVHRLVTDHSLDEQFKRYPTHRGVAALRRAVLLEPALARSEAERRLLQLIETARLPRPETNMRIGRHEVDFLWRAEGLVVEVDGYAFHSSRNAFERDRRRDAELLLAGLRVVRLTWRDVDGDGTAAVAIVAATLAAQAPPFARARSSIVSA